MTAPKVLPGLRYDQSMLYPDIRTKGTESLDMLINRAQPYIAAPGKGYLCFTVLA